MYLHKTPRLVSGLYPSLIWKKPAGDNAVYVTFDDGPHPDITPWVLRLLGQYDAKATFFCVGENVEKHPETYREILRGGHKTGNHTYNHYNGWKTSAESYIENICKCRELVKSSLFRPPYGKITRRQIMQLRNRYEIVMWSQLSGDFDRNLNPEKSLKNLTANCAAGSIIVFHDSEKAFKNLEYLLPRYLDFCASKGFQLNCL